jgi:hypothetical protein
MPGRFACTSAPEFVCRVACCLRFSSLTNKASHNRHRPKARRNLQHQERKSIEKCILQVSFQDVTQLVFQNLVKDMIRPVPDQNDVIETRKFNRVKNASIRAPYGQQPSPFLQLSSLILPARPQPHNTIEVMILKLKGNHTRERFRRHPVPYGDELPPWDNGPSNSDSVYRERSRQWVFNLARTTSDYLAFRANHISALARWSRGKLEYGFFEEPAGKFLSSCPARK